MHDTIKKQAPYPGQVIFYAYPKLLLVWPLIVIGPILWALGSWAGVDQEFLAWVYIFASTLVLVAMGVDVERNQAIFWLVAILAVFFLGMWMESKQILIYANIYKFFNDMDVKFDPNFGLVISIMLAVPYAAMFLWSRLSHKWRITHNEFEQISFGRRDLSVARGAKTVRTSYPDWFELLLCFSGTLVVYDATGSRVLQRIENVPMLPFLRKKIDRILEATAIVDAATIEEMEAPSGTGSDDEADSGGGTLAENDRL